MSLIGRRPQKSVGRRETAVRPAVVERARRSQTDLESRVRGKHVAQPGGVSGYQQAVATAWAPNHQMPTCIGLTLGKDTVGADKFC